MPANEFTLQNELTSSRSAELTLASNSAVAAVQFCYQLEAAMKHMQMYSMLSSHSYTHSTQKQGEYSVV